MLALGAVALVAGLASLQQVQQRELAHLQSVNAALDRELEPLRKLPGVDALEEAAAQLEQRQAVLRELGDARGEGARVLAAVSAAVGDRGAWLTDLSWDGAAVRLTGYSFDPSAGADVMDGLRMTGCFADVVLEGVDTPAADGKRRFRVVATDDAEPCGATHGPLGRPFTPPHDPSKTPAIDRPPLYRWAPDLYRVVALVPGKEAILRDPDGGRHSIGVGSAVGNPVATVSFVTDTAVILSQDEMVDAANDLVVSRILELVLDPE